MADYSKLEKGMKLQAEYDGKFYSAEVVEVSTAKKRAKAPVKVKFVGHEGSDEWLGADRLQSKHIKKAPAAKAEPKKAEPKAKAKAKAKAAAKPKKERPPLEFEMGYWKIRGLGAALRMIFEYRGAKYTDNQFETMDAWFKNKKPEILEMNPLANLPYVVQGGKCVCQTNACLNFVGDRLRLNGVGPARVKNDQLLCEIYDVRNSMMHKVYPFLKVCRDEKEHKEKVKADLAAGPFAKFEKWLVANETEFFCGKTLCTSDFHIWEMLDQHKLLAAKHGIDFGGDIPKCMEFYNKFKELPQLKKYFESDAYKLDINNKGAGAYFA